MASFALLDKDNIVIRVEKACNLDVNNNGGELSQQAADHYKNNTANLPPEGVKYVQTFFSNSYRKRFAMLGGTYDPINDVFIDKKPFNSWILDSDFSWQAPVEKPSTLEYIDPVDNETYSLELITWDENSLTWIGREAIELEYNWVWNNNTKSWNKIS
jgi:hypothetical protein